MPPKKSTKNFAYTTKPTKKPLKTKIGGKTKKIVAIPQRPPCVVENFILVWLDAYINLSERDYQNSIRKLREIVNAIETFTDAQQCRTYLNTIKNERIFLIVSGSLGREIISTVERVSNLETIYIFCRDRPMHLLWSSHYRLIKDVFTDIDTLCQQLKIDIQQSESNLTSISIFSKEQTQTSDLNSLEPSFMYSKLLCEILVEVTHDDQQAKSALVESCRTRYQDNQKELRHIEEFNRTYSAAKAIEWYTRECFTYNMLNKALRTLDIEVTIKMGFFLRHIHLRIERLHRKQNCSQSLIVYRGQGMKIEEFEKLSKYTGGLLSFNSFLSTSMERQVALKFAGRALKDPSCRAILFQMEINPSISTTPFASIENQSHFNEQEVLFSMHTVFRIGEIKQRKDAIWKVELKLTDNNDQQLQRLTEHMRNQTKGLSGWHRLGALMVAMGQYERAEEFYISANAMTSEDNWKELAYLHSQLGHIRDECSDPEVALEYYTDALQIQLEHLPDDHPDLAINYTGIGSALHAQYQLDDALEYFQYALHIACQNSQHDPLEIAKIHSFIGSVYKDEKEYDQALQSYTQALTIREKYLPKGHPSLAIIYNNIGSVHQARADYSTALTYFERTLETEKTSLQSNHPSLAVTYHNIANALDRLGRYQEAVRNQKLAVQIVQKLYEPSNTQRQDEERDLQRIEAKLEKLQVK